MSFEITGRSEKKCNDDEKNMKLSLYIVAEQFVIV